jgi:hypothetical protein
MLTENDVVNAVSDYLVEIGYSIDQKLTTLEHGVDIIAKHPIHGLCLVEAKGATSSKKGSKRYGLEFNKNQVKTHIGVALLQSFKTLQQHKDSIVAIALPNNSNHRELIDSMKIPIKNSGIKVYMVNSDASVEQSI